MVSTSPALMKNLVDNGRLVRDPEIVARVIRIVRKQAEIEGRIDMNACLEDDLGLDSLDFVELIMNIEEEFGIEITDEVAEQVRTVEQAIHAVIAHRRH